MEKFPQAHELLLREREGLRVCHVGPQPEASVLRVHQRAYLHAIRDGRLTQYARNRLGLPHDHRLYERSRMETAGTVAACRAALTDRVSSNLAGGTHHAMPDRGLGFCVLNDVAVAVHELRVTHPELIIVVLDTDAHQGNGTHHILADDPYTFCYSIHVGKNYPSQKVAGDVDVALPRFASGDHYLSELTRTVPDVLRLTEPDLVIWISGADVHENDRFGQLCLTDRDIRERNAFILTQVEMYACPLAHLYGGGYSREPGKTARLHADAVAMTADLYKRIHTCAAVR